MGGRKFKLGRHHKNYERKRQAKKRSKAGRPTKAGNSPSSHETITVNSSPQNNDHQNSLDNLNSSLSLPRGWIVEAEQEKLILCKMQQCVASTSRCKQPMAISHCLEIKKDMSWTLFVHGHKVDLQNCCAMRTTNGNLEINQLVEKIDSLNICAGHPESRFSEITQARKREFKSSSGSLVAFVDDYCPISLNGEVYDSTIRMVKCELLVNGVKCECCKQYRSTLRSMCHRQNSHKAKQSSAVSSHANYRYLKTPEQRERMSQLKAELDHSKREINRLKAKIEIIQEKEGVSIDEDLEQDLQTIMEEKTPEIQKAYPTGSFLRLFWDQQLMAVKSKERQQVRWHPLIIKWCLNLKFMSSKAYCALRSVLSLPSERTLRDYTHWIDSSPGFHDDVDKQLMEEAKVKTIPDFQKYVCLLLDEVRIKEDLVYDKHTSQIIGFINLGDVNNQLLQFQHSQTSDKENSLPLPIAKHMLVFIVRGLFIRLEFPYVQFPCGTTSGGVVFPLVWECIKRLEACGLKVIACTADGAASNRKFFRMHRQDGAKEGEVTYNTINVYSSDHRPLYFISDVPHLVKTVRNCWLNSFAHRNTRKLWVNGQHISWDHLTHLYHHHRGDGTKPHSGLSFLPKLKMEHIALTSYFKMRVDLAAQVLSNSVSKALEMEGRRDTTETAKFCHIFNKFFDCLNVRCQDECVRQRKPDMRPFRNESDPRILWLKQDFLGYLDQWEAEIQQRDDTPAEKNRMCLSRETLEGLRITVNSMVEIIPFLLKVKGVKFVLTEKFCQDPLETFFGKQRMKGGSNDNPNVATFLKNTSSLRVQGSVAMKPIRGNCRRGKENMKDIEVDDSPLPKRKRPNKN